MKQLILKILKWIIIIGIIIGIVVTVSNVYMTQKNKNEMTTLAKLQASRDIIPAEVGIVLGAYVQPNGQLSLMLRERMDTGIALYQGGFVSKLLVSGDHGQADYNEVRAMKDYAITKGVPAEDIFMDHAGFSTYETMYRADAIFEIKRAFIVTQEYHLSRALYDAQAMGIDARGVICDTQKYSGNTYRLYREILARSKDFIFCIFKPKPTYLGEVIPITGNGNLTNDE